MAYNQSHRSGGHAPPTAAPVDFSAMLARSAQQQDEGAGGHGGSGHPPASGVYNTAPSGYHEPSALGPSATAPQAPPPVLPAELPPQAFLTSAMLLDFIDKRTIVVLRDDRTFVGVLRSYDQFGNLVLTEASERNFARNPEHGLNEHAPRWLVADVYQGVVTIRGENVSVAGVVDLDQEDNLKDCQISPEGRVLELLAAQKAQKKAETARRTKLFRSAGIEPDFGMEG